MTAEQIKNAIDNGQDIRWSNDTYKVIKDKHNQYLILHKSGHCIGLTDQDGVTLNGFESEFYTKTN